MLPHQEELATELSLPTVDAIEMNAHGRGFSAGCPSIPADGTLPPSLKLAPQPSGRVIDRLAVAVRSLSSKPFPCGWGTQPRLYNSSRSLPRVGSRRRAWQTTWHSVNRKRSPARGSQSARCDHAAVLKVVMRPSVAVEVGEGAILVHWTFPSRPSKPAHPVRAVPK